MAERNKKGSHIFGVTVLLYIAHVFGVGVIHALFSLHADERSRHVHAELHFASHCLLFLLFQLVGHLCSPFNMQDDTPRDGFLSQFSPEQEGHTQRKWRLWNHLIKMLTPHTSDNVTIDI